MADESRITRTENNLSPSEVQRIRSEAGSRDDYQQKLEAEYNAHRAAAEKLSK